jgi:hypothetical protein
MQRVHAFSPGTSQVRPYVCKGWIFAALQLDDDRAKIRCLGAFNPPLKVLNVIDRNHDGSMSALARSSVCEISRAFGDNAGVNYLLTPVARIS